jgi:hypothetical protein
MKSEQAESNFTEQKKPADNCRRLIQRSDEVVFKRYSIPGILRLRASSLPAFVQLT